MAEGFSGECLCGAVEFQSTTTPQFIGQCHCVDCRKTSGADNAVHLMISEDGFTVSGEVKFYDHPANSGNIVSHGFCPTCGSAIYSKNSAMAGVVFVRGSGLDDMELAKPQLLLYTSRAPSWSQLDKSVPNFPEMPEGM